MTGFPVTSECNGCQAIADARELFERIEAIGKAADVGPDRMARALVQLVARWHATLLGAYGPENGGPLEPAVAELVRVFESSLRYEVGHAIGTEDAVSPHVH
jgi:hypothetical protein